MDEDHNLRKRGTHIWTGASKDVGAGKVIVDVQDLPESPASYRDISKAAVTAKVKRATNAAAAGKDVLIRCAHGINRSPTIAKLTLSGMGEAFNGAQYWPNDAWKAFARVNKTYYANQEWKT
jgi:hypothetical protein